MVGAVGDFRLQSMGGTNHKFPIYRSRHSKPSEINSMFKNGYRHRHLITGEYCISSRYVSTNA